MIHAKECDAGMSISSADSGLSSALIGENCGEGEHQGNPQCEGCEENSTFSTGYYCYIASVWVVFELQLSEKSTTGKVAVSSWRCWAFHVCFSPFKLANLSSFWKILSSTDSKTKTDLSFSLTSRKRDSHGPTLWHCSRYWSLIN